MRCEELLAALETGGPAQRRRARRHVRACPRCAAALAAFEALKHELRTAEPLSADARRVWERASAAAYAAPARRVGRRVWVSAAVAVAACVVLVIVAKWMGKTPQDDFGPGPVPTATVVEVIDPATELGKLVAAADELDGQIERLKAQARRMSARRAVALAIDRYGKW